MKIKTHRFLLNCAGQYSDSIANCFGLASHYSLLPVLGIYYDYRSPPSSHKLRTLIYPVPDPEVFFPGAHWNIDLQGNLKIGPNFIPLLWREQYGPLENVQLWEMGRNLKNYGRLMMSKKRLHAIKIEKFDFRNRWMYMRLISHEFAKFRRKTMTKEVQTMTDFPIDASKLVAARPGIMPQLFHNETHELINDFVIEKDQHSLHVLNAVSPGWTCSFAFAEYLGEIMQKILNKEE